MKLLVGLGNPGPEYAETRHNVGVRVVEHFARVHGIAFDEVRFASRFGTGSIAGGAGRAEARLEVALLAPQTWMNRSGSAVAAAVAGLALDEPADSLLVAIDDVDLPFGRLRLRPSGGAGGHRGLADVIERLGRRDVPRLRFGVGRPPGSAETADHVLAPFSDEERACLPAHLARASEAATLVLRDGIVPAMNLFNRDPEPDGPTRAEPGC